MEILSHCYFKYLSFSFLSYPSGIPVMHIFYLLSLPYSYWIFYSAFVNLFFVCISDILKPRNFFLIHDQLLTGPSKAFFISYTVFLISIIRKIIKTFFLSLFLLPIYSCILSTLSIIYFVLAFPCYINNSSFKFLVC